MQIRDNFPEIRLSYSEPNHTALVVVITQQIMRKCNQFTDYVGKFTQMKITGEVTGQAVKENKNQLFFSVRTRKDLYHSKMCSTLFPGEIRKSGCYIKTEKETSCFLS